MNRLIRHRGPDDEGFVCINTENGEYKVCSGDDSIDSVKNKFNNISEQNLNNFDLILGTRRLSIIDLSENGHQPMADKDNKIWISYNGEIYNYIELRDELQTYGFKFKTRSDTEVIINSYLQWGADCVNHFNGMWAFGLWDGYKQSLFLARDRFGIKPLYFTLSQNYFAFSSEIKPLLLLKDKFEINQNLIPFFIIYGNRLNDEETYIKTVQSLKASHYLIYQNRNVITKRYYDIKKLNHSDKKEVQLEEELNSLLYDSIKLRFRSDVPVGTCLSGGFDSSSIVSISSKVSNNTLNTFSAVWKDEQCDESKYIDIVNSRFSSVENKIEPKAHEFEKEFDSLCYYQEIPTEGPGLIPQWYVMKKAKEKVKVLLDGQGGDEVFGGYFLWQTYLRALLKDKKIKPILSELKLFSLLINKTEIHSLSSWLFPRFYNKIIR
ncbi:MAG: asparagine synthase (glutamine-hydrolyzing), partial [Ignavibacteria bacterium]